MQYWLVKSEPEDYSWTNFVRDASAAWTGVRNFQARNNLRQMEKGDLVFFYHSGSEKQIVGIAKVARKSYPDPTASEGDWTAVDLEPAQPVKTPVSLATIKAGKGLQNMPLVKNSRLSVMPLSNEHFQRIIEISSTTLRT